MAVHQVAHRTLIQIERSLDGHAEDPALAAPAAQQAQRARAVGAKPRSACASWRVKAHGAEGPMQAKQGGKPLLVLRKPCIMQPSTPARYSWGSSDLSLPPPPHTHLSGQLSG